MDERVGSRANGLAALEAAVLTGRLSRRDVLKRGAALGLTAPAIAALLAACGSSSKETPAATAGSGGSAPGAGTTTTGTSGGGRGRGSGDLLRILYWQAPPMLNQHYANGNLISNPAALVLEPLIRISPEGDVVAVLCEKAPSLENGGISADGKTVTYTLLEGLVWSDGTPVSSDDAKFTWKWAIDPAAGTTSSPAFVNVDDIEVVDARTFKIHLKNTDPAWYNIFGRGTSDGAPILPKHLLENYMGDKAQSAPFNMKPVGTGPYKVTNFVPGDVVNYEINESYRFPDKPFFKKVEYKGGGDAPSAARAVLQTGEVDYAINLQVEKSVLENLLKSGVGELIVLPDGSVEHVFINFADPNKEVDGARSEPSTQHPFLTDKAVREALALGVDRDMIVSQLYGEAADATANVIVAPDMFVSKNTSYKFSVDDASAALEAAGWIGKPRTKDGVKTKILFQTTVSPLRLKAQEIMKQPWDAIGFEVQLKSIDSTVFFSSDAGNPDTWKRFSADLQMLALNGRPFPIDLMSYWKSIDPAEDIAQKSNGWSGRNLSRWVNEDYNKLWEAASTELDPTKQAELFIKMNDMISDDVVTIPFIARKRVSGKNKRLQGNNPGPWTEDTWDVADWYFEG